jgi:hypothetical protein
LSKITIAAPVAAMTRHREIVCINDVNRFYADTACTSDNAKRSHRHHRSDFIEDAHLEMRDGPFIDPRNGFVLWKKRFMFVEKLSKRCCITLRVL